MAGGKLLSETSGELIIRSGDIEVRLSRKNGCITGIYDTRTGKPLCTVADRPGCERLFRILAMRRGQRGYVCDAHKQTDVKFKERAGGLAIVYDRLIFNGHECACSAVVTIEKSADRELRFSMALENRGDNPVYEIQFPMLPGWQNREGEPSIQLTAGAKWQSTVGQLPRFGFAIHGGRQVSVGYPGSMMYMPWLDFSLSGSGLSMINYMERPYTGGIAGVNLAGHEKGSLECYWWIHYPLIKKGGRWTSPPIGISLRDGDWHSTADRYYKWFKSNIGVKIQQPESLRTAIGFQNIYLRDFDGNRVNESNSLPEHARAGLKYGINHLCVWDYLSLGDYGIYDPDEDLLDYPPGEEKSLRSAINAAKHEETMVSALVNFRHINVRSKFYERYRSEAVLSLDGSEQRENWCAVLSSSAFWAKHLGLNCILLSPRSPETRRRVDGILDKYLALGYNALFFDQPFLYQLDYNHMGEGNRPDDASSAWYDIIEHVRSELRQADPDAYIIGEQFDIFSASRAIDLQMEWNFVNAGIDDLARALYSCPHALLSYVIDYTTAGESYASHAFAAGLLLCLTIDANESNIGKRPELAQHIAELAALRKKCAVRTSYGRFRHTNGISCNNDAGVVAYAYDSSQGPAIVMAAGEEGGTARVRIDRSLFQQANGKGRGRLFMFNGEEQAVSATDHIECKLPANQAAVWYV